MEVVLIRVVLIIAILMMSSKLATPGPLKRTAFPEKRL